MNVTNYDSNVDGPADFKGKKVFNPISNPSCEHLDGNPKRGLYSNSLLPPKIKHFLLITRKEVVRGRHKSIILK